jgi:hypothetical protein
MATVPERFRGLHRGWLAQSPGQQRLGRPLLGFGQRWWRGGFGHWLILPERAMRMGRTQFAKYKCADHAQIAQIRV